MFVNIGLMVCGATSYMTIRMNRRINRRTAVFTFVPSTFIGHIGFARRFHHFSCELVCLATGFHLFDKLVSNSYEEYTLFELLLLSLDTIAFQIRTSETEQFSCFGVSLFVVFVPSPCLLLLQHVSVFLVCKYQPSSTTFTYLPESTRPQDHMSRALAYICTRSTMNKSCNLLFFFICTSTSTYI